MADGDCCIGAASGGIIRRRRGVYPPFQPAGKGREWKPPRRIPRSGIA